MVRLRIGSAILVAVAAVGGCAEVAFKRGDGPDAFAAERASCSAQNPDPAAIRACLSREGWHVADLESDAAPAATAPAMPPAPRASSAVQAAQGAPAPSMPSMPMPQAVAQLAPSGNVSVGSWWKFGGGSTGLSDAVAACVAQLGPDNQPDAGYHLVTRPLYTCLGKQGWHGIGHAG